MAFSGSNIYLTGPNAPGFNKYDYYTSSETMATVLDINGDGYFTDTTGTSGASVSGVKFVAGDRIHCHCSDGDMWLKVSSVASATGIVTVQYAGGNLPIRTWATGTAAGDFGMSPGYYEIGTSIATSSRGVMPVPYPGCEVKCLKVDSGTQVFALHAGACASNISWVDGTTGGGTAVTYDGSNRSMLLQAEGDWFHVVGSSTSRWRVQGYFFSGSAVSEGASVEMPGT